MKPACMVLCLWSIGCQGTTAFRLATDGTSEALEARLLILADAEGREVLVPAMLHIGEADFYSAVGHRVAGCDRVFLEGVEGMPEATAGDAGEVEFELGSYPRQARTLQLVPQPAALPGVPNDRLRSADLTWSQIEEQATARERKLLAGPAPSLPGAPEQVQQKLLSGLLHALTAKTRAQLADQLVDERRESSLPTIIDARNARVVSAALKELEAETVHSVALVYGGAHQAGLESLLGAHGFRRTGQEWMQVFAVDDRGKVRGRSIAFEAEDVAVIEAAGFTVELCWTEPFRRAVWHDATPQESLGVLAPIALEVGQILVVRAWGPQGTALAEPLAAPEVLSLEVASVEPGAVGSSISTIEKDLALEANPAGVFGVSLRLGRTWALSLSGPGSAHTPLRIIDVGEPGEHRFQLLPPPARKEAYRIRVHPQANREGRWLRTLAESSAAQRACQGR